MQQGADRVLLAHARKLGEVERVDAAQLAIGAARTSRPSAAAASGATDCRNVATIASMSLMVRNLAQNAAWGSIMRSHRA
jgi:hypothetical protein